MAALSPSYGFFISSGLPDAGNPTGSISSCAMSRTLSAATYTWLTAGCSGEVEVALVVSPPTPAPRLHAEKAIHAKRTEIARPRITGTLGLIERTRTARHPSSSSARCPAASFHALEHRKAGLPPRHQLLEVPCLRLSRHKSRRTAFHPAPCTSPDSQPLPSRL